MLTRLARGAEPDVDLHGLRPERFSLRRRRGSR
jgi:hypothetical protein